MRPFAGALAYAVSDTCFPANVQGGKSPPCARRLAHRVAPKMRVTEALYVASQNMLPSYDIRLPGRSCDRYRRIALAEGLPRLPRRRLRASAAHAGFGSPASYFRVSVSNIIHETTMLPWVTSLMRQFAHLTVGHGSTRFKLGEWA